MGVSSDNSAMTDVMMVARGGDDFSTRMADFANARKAAEDALAALNIGKDAQAAYEKASALVAQGRDALDKAKGDAAAIVTDAQAKADALIAEADASRVAANAALAEAKDQAKQILADAQKAMDEVNATRLAVEADLKGRNTAMTNAERDMAKRAKALDEAQQAAKDAKARWTDFTGRLRALIEEGNANG